MEILITDIDVKDIRFPTSLLADGSDAMVCNNLILFFMKKLLYIGQIENSLLTSIAK